MSMDCRHLPCRFLHDSIERVEGVEEVDDSAAVAVEPGVEAWSCIKPKCVLDGDSSCSTSFQETTLL